jgi:hypothetical protein
VSAEHRALDLPRASVQEEPHPRPQLVRPRWVDLSGEWEFEYDDHEVGESGHWGDGTRHFDRRIIVPFPPESAASGIGDTGFHDVMWYRRDISAEEVERAGHRPGGRVVLHFGAVDYRCTVWVNGALAGGHEGGHTPFAIDIQDLLASDQAQVIVVRAEDRAADVAQPRGKQDWLRHPHTVWYHRTSGIWQPVWLEATPPVAIEQVHWTPDLHGASVLVEVRTNRPPIPGTACRIRLSVDDRMLGGVEFVLEGQRSRQSIALPALTNGQGFEDLLWSPESPVLIDATVELLTEQADAVASYFGIRSTTVAGGHFLLNDRPYFIRSVLSQGYWPESHLAAPDGAALRDEVELILTLGFNSARVHQKIEDPRFLYWADRLGLALWSEAPSAFEFSATAVERTTREWLETLDRDRSHPSIVTWVPLNESWGVQQIAHNPAQLGFARALLGLTRAIDPTRPVISNDGWEHAESDIVTIHDYDSEPELLALRYGDLASLERMLDGIGPAGRRIMLVEGVADGAPIMLSEFGGIRFTPSLPTDADEAWGYSTAATAADFDGRLESLYEAIGQSPWLAGTCYTQLTDTLQEANGLVTDRRLPKLDAARIRAIVLGNGAPTTA